MNEDVLTLMEIRVESERDANIRDTGMGTGRIDVEETKNVPVVLGERDIMKVATTLAGITTVGEGAAGFNVRGGKADQNLILLNGAPVYNANHFFGFFSVFNSEAIQDMEIYKSSIPARFGGRLSSVFDIESKAADTEKFSATGGVSPVTSRLTLEIPLVKNRSAMMVSGRTTYSNWILKQLDDVNFRENRASFTDLLVRYDHQLNDSEDLTVSGYMSSDRLRLRSDTLFSFSDFRYTNAIGSIQWNRKFNSRLEGSLASHFSRYQYDIEYDQLVSNAFRQDFSIAETSLEAQLSNYFSDRHSQTYGLGVRYYNVNPGSRRPVGESQVVETDVQEKPGAEFFLHFSDDFDFSEKLHISAGLRYSLFSAMGEQQVLRYAEGTPKNSSSVRDTLFFNSGRPSGFITGRSTDYPCVMCWTATPPSSLHLTAPGSTCTPSPIPPPLPLPISGRRPVTTSNLRSLTRSPWDSLRT